MVNFGQENTENENTEKMDAFIQAVTADNNSKMVVIPPGPHNFVDMIVTTIMADEHGQVPVGMAAGGMMEGIDAGMDPELAEAIRMSLEAERERQERMQVDETPKPVAEPSASVVAPASHAEVMAPAGNAEEELDEETAMALAMSMEQFDGQGDAVMGETKTTEIENALKDPSFVDDLLADLNLSKDQVDIDNILNSLNEDASKKDETDKKDKQPESKQ